jgi:hypothetical protein
VLSRSIGWTPRVRCAGTSCWLMVEDDSRVGLIQVHILRVLSIIRLQHGYFVRIRFEIVIGIHVLAKCFLRAHSPWI